MGVRRNCVMGVVLLGLSIVSAPVSAEAGKDDLVNAMMEVYAEELAANPRDYRTYYSRAMAYFGQENFDLALSDINQAIKYFPRREKDDLAQAYLLRAKILTVKGDDKPALTDLNSALRLVPSHRLALKDRGDLLCKLGQYELAAIDYKHLLRLDTRSQSAYMGLARVEAHTGQPVRAKDLLAQAVNLLRSISSVARFTKRWGCCPRRSMTWSMPCRSTMAAREPFSSWWVTAANFTTR